VGVERRPLPPTVCVAFVHLKKSVAFGNEEREREREPKEQKMRREYIEYYARTRRLPISSELFDAAKSDPLGEEAGLNNLAKQFGIPPVSHDCCMSCGDVIADFGFPGEIAKWCTMHKPEGAVSRVPAWLKRERFQNSIERAREMRHEE
jgi:hypothetical protein